MESNYNLQLTQRVHTAIGDTRNYIRNVLLNETAANKTVAKLYKGLGQLQLFPELGFNADERFGKQVNPHFVTRGLIIDDYIAFYYVNEAEKTVIVTHLFSSKSDYVKLL